MKKVAMNESSYNMLKGKIREGINEISYGSVERAYDKNNDIFDDLQTSFEDFYNELETSMIKAEYDNASKKNPYLEKIKWYSDEIYDILSRKGKQRENLYNNINKKFDYNKFYADKEKPEEWEDNYDNLDLRMLQQKYPK